MQLREKYNLVWANERLWLSRTAGKSMYVIIFILMRLL